MSCLQRGKQVLYDLLEDKRRLEGGLGSKGGSHRTGVVDAAADHRAVSEQFHRLQEVLVSRIQRLERATDVMLASALVRSGKAHVDVLQSTGDALKGVARNVVRAHPLVTEEGGMWESLDWLRSPPPLDLPGADETASPGELSALVHQEVEAMVANFGALRSMATGGSGSRLHGSESFESAGEDHVHEFDEEASDAFIISSSRAGLAWETEAAPAAPLVQTHKNSLLARMPTAIGGASLPPWSIARMPVMLAPTHPVLPRPTPSDSAALLALVRTDTPIGEVVVPPHQPWYACISLLHGEECVAWIERVVEVGSAHAGALCITNYAMRFFPFALPRSEVAEAAPRAAALSEFAPKTPTVVKERAEFGVTRASNAASSSNALLSIGKRRRSLTIEKLTGGDGATTPPAAAAVTATQQEPASMRLSRVRAMLASGATEEPTSDDGSAHEPSPVRSEAAPSECCWKEELEGTSLPLFGESAFGLSLSGSHSVRMIPPIETVVPLRAITDAAARGPAIPQGSMSDTSFRCHSPQSRLIVACGDFRELSFDFSWAVIGEDKSRAFPSSTIEPSSGWSDESHGDPVTDRTVLKAVRAAFPRSGPITAAQALQSLTFSVPYDEMEGGKKISRHLVGGLMFSNDYLFAKQHQVVQQYNWDVSRRESTTVVRSRHVDIGWCLFSLERDFARMFQGGDDDAGSSPWKVSTVNGDYSLSASYPREIVVPSSSSDAEIRGSASFRSRGRFPAVSWVYGPVSLSRAAQPKTGLLNKVSADDEQLVQRLCVADRESAAFVGAEGLPNDAEGCNLVIFDARPALNARANQVKGGGCENTARYKGCRFVFLDIDNIHVVRDALAELRSRCVAGVLEWRREQGKASVRAISEAQGSTRKAAPAAGLSRGRFLSAYPSSSAGRGGREERAATSADLLARLADEALDLIPGGVEDLDDSPPSPPFSRSSSGPLAPIRSASGTARTPRGSIVQETRSGTSRQLSDGVSDLLRRELLSSSWTAAGAASSVTEDTPELDRQQQEQDAESPSPRGQAGDSPSLTRWLAPYQSPDPDAEVSLEPPHWEFARKAVRQGTWAKLVATILRGSTRLVQCLVQGCPGLVHCSDGWDRTAQLTSLAQICIDPYYRTLPGLAVLIEKEWLSFGHQFGLRLGTASQYNHRRQRARPTSNDKLQQSPVFIQFLDCLWQIMQHNPTAFQFNSHLLSVIGEQCHAGRFGTFWGDHEQDRMAWARARETTLSLWGAVLTDPRPFVNGLYVSPAATGAPGRRGRPLEATRAACISRVVEEAVATERLVQGSDDIAAYVIHSPVDEESIDVWPHWLVRFAV
jgi:hypothetical protein